METLIVVLLAGIGFVMLLTSLSPQREMPRIMYVETSPRKSGVGCLPLLLIGILLLTLLLELAK